MHKGNEDDGACSISIPAGHRIGCPEGIIGKLPAAIVAGNDTEAVCPEPVRVHGMRTVSVVVNPYLVVQVRICCKESGTSHCTDLLASGYPIPLRDKSFLKMEELDDDIHAVLIFAVFDDNTVAVERFEV